ncbi:substrate-binding domain-containing protein [Phycisphaerales bacterium AB-hyl4]|uniref:Substrate-binding domain-containing protein n=1 Tax=Natronomicrosphaera hydrolytica TaxID=3242702 RepID=A0ABV4UA17_9BACT
MVDRTEQVLDILEHALTDQWATPGRRLRSERDLAMVLDVGRRQVNEALSQLAYRGLLSRTRGSGTYVVKRAEPSDARAARLREVWEQSELDNVDQIFLPTSQSAAPLSHRTGNAPLRLCLCGDWLDASPIHHAAVERMIATVQHLGHALSIVSVLDESGRPLTATTLRQRLRANPADGYLVVDRWGELFSRAAEGIHRPTIFCGNICGLRHEPAVGICQYDVAPQAMRRLSEAGYSRIAMLGYHNPANSMEAQQDAYEGAVDRLGLNYRRCELIRLGDLRSGAIVRQLLESKDRPDAIYLSDQFLAPAVIEALESTKLTLGRHLGLVCFTNRGVSDLPTTWSRYEVDIRLAGQLAVEALLRTIETGEEYASNILLQPRWHPRQSHIQPGTTPPPARKAMTASKSR